VWRQNSHPAQYSKVGEEKSKEQTYWEGSCDQHLHLLRWTDGAHDNECYIQTERKDRHVVEPGEFTEDLISLSGP
jgi:hypothetical protein